MYLSTAVVDRLSQVIFPGKSRSGCTSPLDTPAETLERMCTLLSVCHRPEPGSPLVSNKAKECSLSLKKKLQKISLYAYHTKYSFLKLECSLQQTTKRITLIIHEFHNDIIQIEI